ncbi:transposase [bacterium]|nr:transposase [bacterium]
MRRNRKLTRLPDYDYSRTGMYFVTICPHDHAAWFGQNQDGQIILNQCGKIVEEQWKWLANQYNYISLDEYIIMPDHFHGIINLVGNGYVVGNGRDHSLQHNHSLQHKIKPLPELIGAFKTTSSKLIHKTGYVDFKWQKSFYDHIIRNEIDLIRIRKYIHNNPIMKEIGLTL